MPYLGVIIEESLEDTSVLKDVEILSTDIEKVLEEDNTPWLEEWTMHNVRINNEHASKVAEKLSHSLERNHAWYADYRDNATHYIIFRDRFFKVDRSNPETYGPAVRYGLSLGISEQHLDLSPQMEEWKRNNT